MTNQIQTLVVRGRDVDRDENGLICLNDLWRAAGFSKNQRPGDWRRLPMTTQLEIAVIERITGKSRNWTKDEMKSAVYSKPGTNGGTYADPRLALAYAEYLNPKLALEVKEVFLRYKAADPTLADDILQRATPEANEWAGRRAMGRAVRNRYTHILRDHGARGPDYPACTNATYQVLLDGTARDLKRKRMLPAKSNVRDHLSAQELAFVAASEALATERIEDENSRNGIECLAATMKSASYLRKAIEADRQDRRGRQGALPL